ncbi:MAG TPA: DUF2059 domain-containing protein [Allosphingosinicella sp.]|jgi:hypothetical protein
MIYLLAAALAVATPTWDGQPAGSPPSPTDAAVQLDPQRLAIATAIANQTVPDGALKKVMEASLTGTADMMMDGFLDARMEDFLPAERPETAEDLVRSRQTMREVLAAEDPHFVERMTITRGVMMQEMIAIMSVYEPGLRAALAKAYARRFTVDQLTDIQRFFASPSGRAFAVESLTLAADRDFAEAMSSYAPDLIKKLPTIMEKVKAATAHLPAPPERKKRSARSRR